MNNLRLLVILFALFSTAAFAQNTVSGTITDANSGEAIIGANVLVSGTTTGAQTDVDGKFSFTTDKDYPVTIEVSYVGYTREVIEVENSDPLTIKMTEGIDIGGDLVISASRKAEKIQDAPASISLISQKQLATTAQADPVRTLINVPGVQIQQQSAGRINIEMRGAAGLFGTSVFPIMDYRSLVGPGIGTFDANTAAVNNIDLDRIEVVRGPGSALYGPGVTAGVVHFITKSPIDHTGTTVQVAAGELNTVMSSVRFARANEDKTFGYKINVNFNRGDEFTLDPNDPDDALQIAKFSRTVNRPDVVDGLASGTSGTLLLQEADLDPDGDGNMMQNYYQNFTANTTLEFRPADDLSINASAGFNSGTAVFYNSQGEGLSQVVEGWGQARVQKGGLFAQLFYVYNNGGADNRPTFLYQTGNTTGIQRQQLEGQLQYAFDFDLGGIESSFVAGADYRSALSNTGNLVYGRNEDDDDYNLIGAYIQGKFKLHDKLDLVLAGRYDQFLFIDDGAFAPRAALVWKPSPKHTFRGSFNRASAPNSGLTINIDFPLANIVPGAYDIWLYGNKVQQTFNNPTYGFALPGLPDGQIPVGTPGVGLPLAVPFAATTDAVLAGLQAAEDGGQLPAGSTALLTAILQDPTNTPTGSVGSLGPGYNIFNGSPLGLINAPQTRIRTEDTWEIGYKGLIEDKLGVSVDVYNITARNFTLFTAISPVYPLVGTEDLSTSLGAEVAANTQPDIEAALAGLGDPNAATNAAILAGALNAAYQAAGDGFVGAAGALFPVWATAQTDQMPDNGITHVAAGYRTFDQINYTGLDLGLTYYIQKDLSAFFNYSFVSQTEFTVDVVEAEGLPALPYSLGVPGQKYRAGIVYAPAEGWNVNVAYQHDPSFLADFGQFSGMTDEKNLVDLGIGYGFENGLKLNLAVTNLFDNEYRAFPNMPRIGRRAMVRATYHFD